MNKIKSILAILCMVLMLALTGCFGQGSIDNNHYYGEDVDLSTQITNNIFGIYDIAICTIVVLEEDYYGRRMFYCRIGSILPGTKMEGGEVFGILITQKTDEKYVYFYPDYNFIIYEFIRKVDGEVPTYEEELALLAQTHAIYDEIEVLKDKNDWGEPFDEVKCDKVKMSRKDRDYESRISKKLLVSDELKQKAYEYVAPHDPFYPGYFYYLTSDDYDRHIYFFRSVDENNVYKKSCVVVFNKDGSFDAPKGIMDIIDLWHYQDDMKVFKERNGWNMPPL